MFNYKLTKTDRKTLALYVRKDGSLEVRAPKNATKAVIEAFVASKKDWILKTTDKVKKENARKLQFSLHFGDFLLYMGREYEILEASDNFVSFDEKNFYMPVNCELEVLKQAFCELYKKLAKREIVKKVEYYSRIMNASYSNVKINSAKTRWGSCSGKSSLNFSWRLIFADENAIDYVVVHELAHTVQHNHSSKFWDVVEHTMPDYKNYKALLKDLQGGNFLENWG